MTVDLLELRPEPIEAADMLRRANAPEAEQLVAPTDAIRAFSASLGPPLYERRGRARPQRALPVRLAPPAQALLRRLSAHAA